jgi:hypothetical protein
LSDPYFAPRFLGTRRIKEWSAPVLAAPVAPVAPVAQPAEAVSRGISVSPPAQRPAVAPPTPSPRVGEEKLDLPDPNPENRP